MPWVRTAWLLTATSVATFLIGVTGTSAAPAPVQLSRVGWTVVADSQETAKENGQAANVLDGDPATLWHTAWSSGPTAFPHLLTIDTQVAQAMSGLVYQPRPASSGSNGTIGRYTLETSLDGVTYTAAASGTLPDTAAQQTLPFPVTTARYVRLTALSEAGSRGSWTSAAELGLLDGSVAAPTASPTASPTLRPTVGPTASAGVPPRSAWTVVADSQETVKEDGRASNVLDGNPATLWHTAWSTGTPAFPHVLTIDTTAAQPLAGLVYQPRPANSGANGTVGRYTIETSFTAAASGTLPDTAARQTVPFPVTTARYVRLTALSEAGNRGPWTSAAELDLVPGAAATPTPTPSATPTPTPSQTPSPTTSPTASPTAPPRSAWTVRASSEETQGEDGRALNVLDGNPATIWHTAWVAGTQPFPHVLTIDTQAVQPFGALIYTPRPASSGRNGAVGQYTVETSVDGSTFTVAASGTLPDASAPQTISFPVTTARYVRLTALTEAGNRGAWTSAAELDLLPAAPSTLSRGQWGPLISFPLVPVTAALLPANRVLTMAASNNDTSTGYGTTQTATLDLTTSTVSARTVAQTQHAMFCPGTALLPDGRLLVNGGSDDTKTSLYDPVADVWSASVPMALARGYQSAATLGNGDVFTLGGSWNDSKGGKDGEVWSPGKPSRLLPGAAIAPSLTADPEGIFRQDNHGWLFTWTGGRVFHAGPSRAMGFYGTDGDGSYTAAGLRGDDSDAMNGNAVMYDAGKLLTVGGSPAYSHSIATDHAYAIDLNPAAPAVTTLAPMANPRAFASSVVLPDGSVLVVGGQNYAVPFTDATAVMTPELWDPMTQRFTELAPMSVPRVYHSVSLLLPDARVLTAGGGLCGTCDTNHPDGQIFTPPYLLDADGNPRVRPTLSSAPTSATRGDTIAVTTGSPVASFSLVRMSSITHSINTDQRRIALTSVSTGPTSYALSLPAAAGILVPGPYLLFALDSSGTPSVARTVFLG
jgi:galactose oxidase